MRRTALTAAAIAGTGAIAMLAGSAPSALADGPCGANYSLATACPLNGAATVNGTLVNRAVDGEAFGDGLGGEDDYYEFSASRGTQLSTTITDEYSCNAPMEQTAGPPSIDSQCGFMEMYLATANSGGSSNPGDPLITGTPSGYARSTNDGGTPHLVLGSLATGTRPFNHNGVYYLVVEGSPATDWETWTATYPTPYTFSVTVTAHSAPVGGHCVVPRFSEQTVTTVRRRLIASHCAAGPVRWVAQRNISRRLYGRPRQGNVFALVGKTHKALRPGTVLPNGTTLSVWAAGPKTVQTRSR